MSDSLVGQKAFNGGANARRFKFLIADDSASTLALFKAIIVQLGFEAVAATNGQEAVELYREHRPDLVLLDVVMPVMDGFQALEQIRAIPSTRWVPVVFLTALDDPDILKKALIAGADDFLSKPVRLDVLRAKIMALGRAIYLQDQVLHQQVELEAYRDAAEEEKRIARGLLEMMSNTNGIAIDGLRILSKPAEQLNGDIVAAARTPSGKLHVLLADGTGHGLTAALNVLPAVEPFYSMTSKGFALPTILDELNRKLHKYLPSDCFVATCLLSIDMDNQRIELWNAGLPDVLLIDRATHGVRRLRSRNLPLGILRPADFDAVTESHDLSTDTLAVLASDGLVEALADTDLDLGCERLASIMLASVENSTWPDTIEVLSRSSDRTDDLTLVAIDCGRLVRAGDDRSLPANADGSKTNQAPGGDWAVEITLDALRLRQSDIVPVLLNLVSGFGLVKRDAGDLFVILSELFNNALDHGLLCMDTEYKNGSADMERYFELREARLERLEIGSVSIRIARTTDERGALLEVTVSDSGAGFDSSKLQRPDGTSRGGRGLSLVRSLCESLEFRGTGNIAVARLQLENPAPQALAKS